MSQDQDDKVNSQVMELRELISGPLTATIEADALSAQKYMECLMRIALDADPADGRESLRMLTFSYTDRSLGRSERRTFSVPLLTVVPLPLLHVQEAEFDFDVQILDVSGSTQTPTFSFRDWKTTRQDQAGQDNKMRVTLAHSSSMSTNMKVRIRMGQSDLPGGLAALLNRAVNNMIEDVAETEPEK